jgi:hypothetical protein
MEELISEYKEHIVRLGKNFPLSNRSHNTKNEKRKLEINIIRHFSSFVSFSQSSDLLALSLHSYTT